MRSRPLLALIGACLTVLAVRAVAGHDALSGPTLVTFTASHGIDLGDVPVLVIWLVGLGCCAALWRRS